MQIKIEELEKEVGAIKEELEAATKRVAELEAEVESDRAENKKLSEVCFRVMHEHTLKL